MHDHALTPAAGAPAALTAFLRGTERRAFLFLWLQSGDPVAAERALAAAMRAFAGPAARTPMADWPLRFWKLLLALPVEPGQAWPPALASLASMRPQARRALLLRQVAGLDEPVASQLLDLDEPGYRMALAEACPRDASGAPDAAGWRAQAEAIQQAGRDLDSAQLLRLMQLRETALAGHAVSASSAPARPEAAPVARRPARPGAGRWRLGVAAALACALLVAAALWWPSSPGVGPAQAPAPPVEDLRVHDNPPVEVEPLPEAEPPPASAELPLPLQEVAHDPVVAELALLSWLAAGAPPSRFEQESEPGNAVAGIDDMGGEPSDWARLDALEQAQVRAAAVDLQARDRQAQADLRARFLALDAMERRGWRLGPGLGADYALLQPLVGFVAEGEREPLLSVLRGLGAEQRAQLAALALRTPPTERERLRRELLATPPDQRGAWLEQRQR